MLQNVAQMVSSILFTHEEPRVNLMAILNRLKQPLSRSFGCCFLHSRLAFLLNAFSEVKKKPENWFSGNQHTEAASQPNGF
jgi:hypothetical protein